MSGTYTPPGSTNVSFGFTVDGYIAREIDGTNLLFTFPTPTPPVFVPPSTVSGGSGGSTSSGGSGTTNEYTAPNGSDVLFKFGGYSTYVATEVDGTQLTFSWPTPTNPVLIVPPPVTTVSGGSGGSSTTGSGSGTDTTPVTYVIPPSYSAPISSEVNFNFIGIYEAPAEPVYNFESIVFWGPILNLFDVL
jgi:hypothetical protein